MKARARKNFVGQKVRRLRKERGMTQSELASRIGIIQSDLCRMEKGEYKVSLETLFRILQVFGMNIGEFFDEGATADAPRGIESELWNSFSALSAEAKKDVLDYVRFKAQRDGDEEPPSDTPAAGGE